MPRLGLMIGVGHAHSELQCRFLRSCWVESFLTRRWHVLILPGILRSGKAYPGQRKDLASAGRIGYQRVRCICALIHPVVSVSNTDTKG